ncbi:MAG: hypothetical protein ACOX37_01770 [Bacillota bacterium]
MGQRADVVIGPYVEHVNNGKSRKGVLAGNGALLSKAKEDRPAGKEPEN